jgi:hypothetical protein
MNQENKEVKTKKYISIKCNANGCHVYVEAERYQSGKEDGFMILENAKSVPYLLVDIDGKKVKMQVSEDYYITYVQDGRTIIRKDIFKKLFRPYA